MDDWEFDEISYWSEVKLDILKEYAASYSTILSAQEKPRLHHVYIDGFAGSGHHMSRERKEIVEGSPTIALGVTPPFKEYHFIDLRGNKVSALKKLVQGHKTATVHQGDCNQVLLHEVFPRVKWEDYKRGLCVLDPYAVNLNWQVLEKAGEMRELFPNPVDRRAN